MILAILSAIAGFATPWVGEVFKFFTVRGDRAHELALFEMRLKAGAQDHLWRMEEINAKADIAETAATHRPMQSFGVQLLDKAHDSGLATWAWAPVFYLFALLDFLRGLVVPALAYVVFGFYFAYRWACIKAAQEVITGKNFWDALMGTYNDNDWAILFAVLAFYVGDRTRQKVRAGK